ncbi:hypothetical protein QZH41_015139 [Actinostola sp. cb2023]|nr:hypothetical protein QZH41_015139 [Actinostola sp. cb2023]
MLCSFSTLVDDNVTCGISPEYQVQSECVPLAKCERDVTTHLEMYGISDDPFILKSEMKLLLARAGIFSLDESSHGLITICPRHRAEYGIRWRTESEVLGTKTTDCTQVCDSERNTPNEQQTIVIYSQRIWSTNCSWIA